MRKYVFLIVLSFILLGCAEKEFFEYNHEHFKIDIPACLNEVKEKPADAICEFELKSEGNFVELRVVIYEDVKSFVEGGFDIHDYYKFVANDLLDNTLESGSLNTPNEEIINGMDALIFEIEGKYRFEDKVYDMFFLSSVYETEDHYYEVTTWTETSTKEVYYNDMISMIRSFALRGKK